MVSRVTFFEVFPSTVCRLCAILEDVIRHMRNSNRAPRGFRISPSIEKPTLKPTMVYVLAHHGRKLAVLSKVH